jgi:hypothetical protein
MNFLSQYVSLPQHVSLPQQASLHARQVSVMRNRLRCMRGAD